MGFFLNIKTHFFVYLRQKIEKPFPEDIRWLEGREGGNFIIPPLTIPNEGGSGLLLIIGDT